MMGTLLLPFIEIILYPLNNCDIIESSTRNANIQNKENEVIDLKGCTLHKYNPQRDKTQIEKLLIKNNDLLLHFYKDEENNKDHILVALINTRVAGFLSFNGFGRRPQATLFVSMEDEGADIGSMLLEEYENKLIHNEVVEHTIFTFNESNNALKLLLENHGYRLYFSSYMMERIGPPFSSEPIQVRQYEEKDYLAWDRICELAFFHMRERIGMYPSFFYTPVEWEREQFAKNKENMFVMLIDNQIVAIGKIDGPKICTVAIAIEHQSRGYGRALIKFLVNEILRRGEDKVILEVVKGNFAKALYEDLGFKETALHLSYVKYFRPDTRLSAPPDNY